MNARQQMDLGVAIYSLESYLQNDTGGECDQRLWKLRLKLYDALRFLIQIQSEWERGSELPSYETTMLIMVALHKHEITLLDCLATRHSQSRNLAIRHALSKYFLEPVKSEGVDEFQTSIEVAE